MASRIQRSKRPPPSPAAPAAEQRSAPADKDRVERLYPPADGAFAAQLGQASAAFNAGDFRQARTLARRALHGDPTAAERDFAQQILYRTGIDPAAIAVGVVGLLLFVLLAWSTLY